MMDEQDLAYVQQVLNKIGRKDIPVNITFWMSGEYFIGTSFVFGAKDRVRYWVPAFEDPIQMRDRWTLLWHIKPRTGEYLSYEFLDGKWRAMGLKPEKYDHTQVDFYRQG